MTAGVAETFGAVFLGVLGELLGVGALATLFTLLRTPFFEDFFLAVILYSLQIALVILKITSASNPTFLGPLWPFSCRLVFCR